MSDMAPSVGQRAPTATLTITITGRGARLSCAGDDRVPSRYSHSSATDSSPRWLRKLSGLGQSRLHPALRGFPPSLPAPYALSSPVAENLPGSATTPPPIFAPSGPTLSLSLPTSLESLEPPRSATSPLPFTSRLLFSLYLDRQAPTVLGNRTVSFFHSLGIYTNPPNPFSEPFSWSDSLLLRIVGVCLTQRDRIDGDIDSCLLRH